MCLEPNDSRWDRMPMVSARCFYSQLGRAMTLARSSRACHGVAPKWSKGEVFPAPDGIDGARRRTVCMGLHSFAWIRPYGAYRTCMINEWDARCIDSIRIAIKIDFGSAFNFLSSMRQQMRFGELINLTLFSMYLHVLSCTQFSSSL
jgi:hypothetical protein